MWIRTSDKSMLLNADSFQIIRSGDLWGIVTKENYAPLATYSSYKNALAMMDIIEDSVANFPDGVVYLRKDDELD